MVNTQGFNPTTGEWNDSLTGDFIWTNTNIGEAFSDVMTPFTWSLVGALYDGLSVLPGHATAGDVGAALSHAAIVARELGIPAVVGCGDATARLKTGDRVTVDGGAGTVTLMLKT